MQGIRSQSLEPRGFEALLIHKLASGEGAGFAVEDIREGGAVRGGCGEVLFEEEELGEGD